ncbi:G-type lectin S-receptor-like serine/threonine-protein kinase LECRK1 [Quercus robur]|uniref:G-type lectin S-receptor-like serine/threonine-protein kinase LECRK1 n=1 Tax=Quercus robur TaxID=38942 RepID=UPI002162DF2C|nr:G-type lectin S-receptor-like serine/threonine-protein kinase LECRK1 [Quercus robur]
MELVSNNTKWEAKNISVLSSTQEACKAACLDECKCEAALFKDGECTMQSLPFRFVTLLKDDSNVALSNVPKKELEKVTENFKEELGRGAFGIVYKGAIGDGKKLIAVRRLDKLLAEREREFQTEMKVIGRTHHKNLVQLLGYCHDGPNRLLVYEYMSNGSLADIIYTNNCNRDSNLPSLTFG